MDKLKMSSVNKINENIEKISNLFPNCLTERIDINGKIKLAIDFDILKQELFSDVVEGSEERYQFTWPDKKKSVLLSNAPIAKTLRPCKEESKNFDTTENIYIEGDNLDVLKLLQETYLNKIKMIYIDPPYNTGNDFIYKDDFSQNVQDYLQNSGQFDENGNRLFKNMETNGRFHTDWLNMIYPRLKLAKDLLRDDGVIFISIDDNEQANLKKICDEIFGESNFVADFIRKTKSTTNDAKIGLNYQHEFLLCYAKNKENINLLGGQKDLSKYKNPDNDPNGAWVSGDPSAKSGKMETGYFAVKNPYTDKEDYPPEGLFWRFSKNTIQKHIDEGRIFFKKEHKENERGFIYKRYLKELKTELRTFDSLKFSTNEYMNQNATKELLNLGLAEYFKYPKGVDFIKKIILHVIDINPNDIILDFFSGSATTAHAVMQLNAENLKDRVEASERKEINLDESKIDLAQNNMVNSNFSSTPPQALRF